jgi:cytochrome b561
VANVLLAVIVLHAAAALDHHHFIRRDNTLNRMLPKALRSKPRQEWHL